MLTDLMVLGAEFDNVAPLDRQEVWPTLGSPHRNLLKSKRGPETDKDHGYREEGAGDSPLSVPTQIALSDKQYLACEEPKPREVIPAWMCTAIGKVATLLFSRRIISGPKPARTASQINATQKRKKLVAKS